MPKRLIPAILLAAYSALLIKVMVFKDIPLIRIGSLMLNFGGTDASHPANFIPFKTILPYLMGYKGWIIAGINLGGNILLLVPVGLLIPFVFKNITWKKSLIIAIASGLLIETLQVVLHVGIFDIDDVILNALGVMIGFWKYEILMRWIRTRNYKSIIITWLLILAIVGGLGYALYPIGEQAREPQVIAGDDLCGGTNGTGEIVTLTKKKIVIKRNDESLQTIALNDQTTIKTGVGDATAKDLKVGDRVTIVIYDNVTATAVLVCNKKVE